MRAGSVHYLQGDQDLNLDTLDGGRSDSSKNWRPGPELLEKMYTVNHLLFVHAN